MNTTTLSRRGAASSAPVRLSAAQTKLLCQMMEQPQRQSWRHYEHPRTFDSLVARGLAKVVSAKREKVVRAQMTVAGARAWSKATGTALAD